MNKYSPVVMLLNALRLMFQHLKMRSRNIQSNALNGMAIVVVALLIISSTAHAKKCTGEFVNPITDINWGCMFPITIGSMEIVGSDLADTGNPSSPVCVCPKGDIPVPGIVGGYWEPARMVDVSAEPYCFVNLGGLEIDMGFERSQGGRPKAESAKMSSWYVHYYIYPILSMLEIFTDFIMYARNKF
jgi:conjugal transfer pilus assembly protein TraU